MHRADTQTGSPAVSALELHCNPVHPKNIVDDEPDWRVLRQIFTTAATGLWPHEYLSGRRGIAVYRRAVVRRTRRSIFSISWRFPPPRARMVFAVKKSQTASCKTEPG
jgi:hypothetical protein